MRVWGSSFWIATTFVFFYCCTGLAPLGSDCSESKDCKDPDFNRCVHGFCQERLNECKKELVGQPCDVAGKKGICSKGVWVCEDKKNICQETKPSEPKCPGLLDNDCDGLIDCEVKIKPGTFTMGSSVKEVGAPEWKVTLTHLYAVWRYEFTYGLYLELTTQEERNFITVGGTLPFPKCDHHDRKRCPLFGITWHEGAFLTNALSRKHALDECYSCNLDKENQVVVCTEKPSFVGADLYKCNGFRLPTEAEWERAARAGTETDTYAGNMKHRKVGGSRAGGCLKDEVLNKIAAYCGNSVSMKGIGLYKPNAWGLYDMLGNGWEFNHGYRNPFNYPPINPVGRIDGLGFSARGGSWWVGGYYLNAGKLNNPDLTALSKDPKGKYTAKGAVTGFRRLPHTFRPARVLISP